MTVFPTLRTRLRQDLEHHHAALDARLSTLDLSQREGFVRFLQIQASALRALEPISKTAQSAPAIADLRARAETDLRQLQSTDPVMPAPATAPIVPLAIDYVIAGSQLGSKILKKRWNGASDPHVRQASAYFSAPSYISHWREFCETADGMTSIGDAADQIVAGAFTVFDVYARCADQVLDDCVDS